jgi:hypothetical protein
MIDGADADVEGMDDGEEAGPGAGYRTGRCMLCLKRPPDVQITPCGHIAFCQLCAPPPHVADTKSSPDAKAQPMNSSPPADAKSAPHTAPSPAAPTPAAAVGEGSKAARMSCPLCKVAVEGLSLAPPAAAGAV